MSHIQQNHTKLNVKSTYIISMGSNASSSHQTQTYSQSLEPLSPSTQINTARLIPRDPIVRNSDRCVAPSVQNKMDEKSKKTTQRNGLSDSNIGDPIARGGQAVWTWNPLQK